MRQRLTKKVDPRRVGSPARTWISGLLLAVVIAVGGIGAPFWLRLGIEGTLRPAPTFSLPASTGSVVSLKEYLGKGPLILLFYMTAT